MNGQPRRVLAIDGGGIRGVFPAAFLAEMEKALGRPVGQQFDLVAGTSTGGIIAIALGLGLSGERILDLYREVGARVFARQGMVARVAALWRERYRIEPLADALNTAFGTRLLGDSTLRLLIPTFDLAAERVEVFKTSHHEKLHRDWHMTAVDVALAAIAAPGYFPVHLSPGGMPHIDGGIWARNPLGLAVIEAMTNLQWPPWNLRVLSLGCTSASLGIAWKDGRALGAAYWMARLADVFMKAQSSSALSLAHDLLGEDAVIRINPHVAHAPIDDVGSIDELEALGRAAARTALPRLEQQGFLGPQAPAFVPFHN